MKSVRIDFACNDPDNGHFAGRVCQINIPAVNAELVSKAWSITSFRGTPRLREEPGRIVLAGKPWMVTGGREWVGNWCWNAFYFHPGVGWSFLSWLHRRGLFRCEGGETWFCDLWDREDAWPRLADPGFIVRWQEARL